ncbi:mandelate racemase/muconate lactonizing enzyme family protein [Prosthecomicrobium hirschii]|uniref:mandelate racemase/muconate lactonizing enzyme family protein n=1 Tax=Prosthecodimorpha hirschii TaxID=665126 RepID=UPI00221F18CA|nr:mandelate racemase/muconate lactonizing enzyme family protein [Prosthecomicrobium hirschii]MCW1839503.1 mandelate racemase/muconate lactonizing enzyme family protein [Prosthecomicrobium hirschii]
MKITAIEITHHRLPLDPPFNASWDTRPRTHFDATIVRVKTDEGLEGIASGDTMTGFAGHEPMFVGQDPLAIERHYRILSNIQFHYGRCWPLDLALWDLAGKIAGQPVWKLLGGLSDRVRAYASSGTLRAPAALADAAEAYLAQGFKALKIRFHRGDWRADVAALEAVRARVGDRLELMVDCNQGWRMSWDAYAPWSLKDALQVAREMERIGVYWMEEPLFRADRDGMRRLREMVDVRIAGGEMTREIYEFRDLIRDGCLDVVQPDAALVGGISGLRRVAAMAEAANLVFTPHTWTNGMGVVANAHLTCGLADAPFMEFPFDPPEWSLDRRDFPMRAPLEIDADGFVVLSDRPGMGYELDEDRLAATRIG